MKSFFHMRKKGLNGVFVFDSETCNIKNQQFCEPNAAGVYLVNRSYDCLIGDSTEKELQIESEHVHVFVFDEKTTTLLWIWLLML